MERSAFQINYVDSAKHQAGVALADTPQLVAYPYADVRKSDSALAVAYVGRIDDARDSSTHTVVVSYRLRPEGGSYNVWCSDKFLEGRGIPKREAEERCASAVASAGAALAKPDELQASMMKTAYAKFTPSGACDFWTHWRKSRKLCAHTEAFLAQLKQAQPGFLDELKAAYEAMAQGTFQVRGSSSVGLADLVRKAPVLLEGEQGSGKTFEAFAFARANGYPAVLVAGNESVEAQDLLGHYVPDGKKGLVWKDGRLAEAFRRASTGPVVLVLDELLRIPQRQLSVLLTALTPVDGNYRLGVGRIVDVKDGVGAEEQLCCPVGNLLVIATTNVGAQFAIEDLDPALAERFVPMRRDTTKEALTAILESVVTARGFSAKVTERLVSFYEKMKELKRTGSLNRTPSTRTLVRAVQWAANEGDIKNQVLVQRLLWVDRDVDGYPVSEQESDITTLADRIFK